MIIEEGKKYRCRNGLVVDHVEPERGDFFVWRVFLRPGQDFPGDANIRNREGANPWFLWTREGTYGAFGDVDPMDALEVFEDVEMKTVFLFRFKSEQARSWSYVVLHSDQVVKDNIKACRNQGWRYNIFELEIDPED